MNIMTLKKCVPLILVVLCNLIPIVLPAAPGSFFWKPRLGIDLRVGPTESSGSVPLPSKENVRNGLVVIINGYEIGLTMVALIGGMHDICERMHMHPKHAWFYTDNYRWLNRHLSLMPYWIGGEGKENINTHKAWTRRFHYINKFVPTWMTYLFPWVPRSEWEKEKTEFIKYLKYAEPYFIKHYRYPGNVYTSFASEETTETKENLDESNSDVINIG